MKKQLKLLQEVQETVNAALCQNDHDTKSNKRNKKNKVTTSPISKAEATLKQVQMSSFKRQMEQLTHQLKIHLHLRLMSGIKHLSLF